MTCAEGGGEEEGRRHVFSVGHHVGQSGDLGSSPGFVPQHWVTQVKSWASVFLSVM